MNVLFTLAVLAVGGLWGIAVYNRLIGLRRKVTAAWKELDAQLKDEAGSMAAARQTYNDAVLKYNNALQAFPAYLIAALAGFQAAKRYDS